MIRHANIGDIPHLVTLVEREHMLSPWRGEVFDRGAAASSIRSFIEGFNRTMLMSEHGYFAGLVQSMTFSHVPWGIEFAWYAEDGQGFPLLQAFEGWAQRMGAKRVVVNDIISHGGLSKVLVAKHGYAPLGTSLQKDI